MSRRRRAPVRWTWPRVVAALIGVGLMAAPVAFRMFERAPKGGHMIEGFRPYMSTARISSFRSQLATIGAARDDAARLTPQQLGSGPTSAFVQSWPSIDADMTSMLDTMQTNIGRYRGVAALPPFSLFPWFFVVPGIAIVAVSVLVRRPAVALGALGVGLLLAPAVFQMFTRAPGGAAMIDDFRPFMTPAKVTKIQGYFLTIGGAEAELRRSIVPALPGGQLPQVETLNRQWPGIAADMAPMIGAMSDNVGNFQAVAALPPFWLFPWFFVIPGLLLGGLGVAARREPLTEPSVNVDVRAGVLEGARS